MAQQFKGFHNNPRDTRISYELAQAIKEGHFPGFETQTSYNNISEGEEITPIPEDGNTLGNGMVMRAETISRRNGFREKCWITIATLWGIPFSYHGHTVSS